MISALLFVRTLCKSKSNLLAIVARQVVVSHGQAVIVILGKLLTLAQQFVRLCVATVAHVLHRQHVADVADLDADLRKLGTQRQ